MYALKSAIIQWNSILFKEPIKSYYYSVIQIEPLRSRNLSIKENKEDENDWSQSVHYRGSTHRERQISTWSKVIIEMLTARRTSVCVCVCVLFSVSIPTLLHLSTISIICGFTTLITSTKCCNRKVLHRYNTQYAIAILTGLLAMDSVR